MEVLQYGHELCLPLFLPRTRLQYFDIMFPVCLPPTLHRLLPTGFVRYIMTAYVEIRYCIQVCPGRVLLHS